MLKMDAEKSNFDIFTGADADFYLVDIISEQYPVWNIDGQLLTESWIYERHGIRISDVVAGRTAFVHAPYSQGRLDMLLDGIAVLLDKAREKGIQDRQILFHCPYASLVTRLTDGRHVAWNTVNQQIALNGFLYRAYAEIAARWPKLGQFSGSPAAFIGDSKHHWGPSPLHFIRDYYTSAYDVLMQRIA